MLAFHRVIDSMESFAHTLGLVTVFNELLPTSIEPLVQECVKVENGVPYIWFTTKLLRPPHFEAARRLYEAGGPGCLLFSEEAPPLVLENRFACTCHGELCVARISSFWAESPFDVDEFRLACGACADAIRASLRSNVVQQKRVLPTPNRLDWCGAGEWCLCARK